MSLGSYSSPQYAEYLPMKKRVAPQKTSEIHRNTVIEGSLKVKLLTKWTDEKAEVGRIREEKRIRKKIRGEKESEERRCRCAKRYKSRETLCFSNVLGLGRVEK